LCLRNTRFTPEDAEPPVEARAVEANATISTASATFLPVELVDEADGTPSSDLSAGPRPARVMEIVLAGGHRLRIEGPYDPDALARFLRALSEPSP
jgi:transposase